MDLGFEQWWSDCSILIFKYHTTLTAAASGGDGCGGGNDDAGDDDDAADDNDDGVCECVCTVHTAFLRSSINFFFFSVSPYFLRSPSILGNCLCQSFRCRISY